MSDTASTVVPIVVAVVVAAGVAAAIASVIVSERRKQHAVKEQLRDRADADRARARAREERRDADLAHAEMIGKAVDADESVVLSVAWASVTNGDHDDLRLALDDLARDCRDEAWDALAEGQRGTTAYRCLQTATVCRRLVGMLDEARDGVVFAPLAPSAPPA